MYKVFSINLVGIYIDTFTLTLKVYLKIKSLVCFPLIRFQFRKPTLFPSEHTTVHSFPSQELLVEPLHSKEWGASASALGLGLADAANTRRESRVSWMTVLRGVMVDTECRLVNLWKGEHDDL